MAVLTELCTVFDVFHDGWITELAEGPDRLTVTVTIEYLAERVRADYRRFTVELFAPYRCQFTDWEKWQTTDLQRITDLELDILGADVVSRGRRCALYLRYLAHNRPTRRHLTTACGPPANFGPRRSGVVFG